MSASFARRMTRENPYDPLLLQVLPSDAESVQPPGFTEDPVGDADACLETGLLQKYRGRVLTAVTEACPLHCRFCFRRNRPSDAYAGSAESLDRALLCIERDPSLREVILSGGDPLMLPLDRLERTMARLGGISHVHRVRIHTRLPIADPACIRGDLVQVLARSEKPLVVVIHCNHPAELNDETAIALDTLSSVTRGLLCQSVLLKNINDNMEDLSTLSEKLIEQRVLPYYLHQLDRALGTAHFEVDEGTGRRLVTELRVRCPGYLVPRYVREIPKHPSKTVLL